MNIQMESSNTTYVWPQVTGPARVAAFNQIVTWMANNPSIAQNIAKGTTISIIDTRTNTIFKSRGKSGHSKDCIVLSPLTSLTPDAHKDHLQNNNNFPSKAHVNQNVFDTNSSNAGKPSIKTTPLTNRYKSLERVKTMHWFSSLRDWLHFLSSSKLQLFGWARS